MSMSSRRNAFVSCRRTLLDRCLERIRPQLAGQVLDVGGRAARRRGSFVPPIDAVQCWVTVNPDPAAGADVVGSLPGLPFPDGRFDALVCTEVLEYVEDAEAAVADLARVLGARGTAYVSVPFLHRLHGDSGSDCHRFTGPYLKRLFGRHFAVVDIEPMGGPAAVIFDLLWVGAARRRWLRPPFRLAGRLIAGRDVGRDADCTGFFIVAHKCPPPLCGAGAGAPASEKT